MTFRDSKLDIEFIREIMKTYEQHFGSKGVADMLYSMRNNPELLSKSIGEMLGEYVPVERVERDFTKLSKFPEKQAMELLERVGETYISMGYMGYMFTFQDVINAR